MENIQKLIGRVQKGDPEAFRTLVELFQEEIFQFTFHLTGSWDDADELSQQVFIKVFRKIGQFRGDANFKSWLYRIATNVHIDHCRSQKVRQSLFAAPGPADSQVAVTAILSTTREYDPEERMMSSQINRDIQKALNALSAKQRVVFVMRHYQNLPLQDIAHLLGISLGSVKSHLFRAVRNLQKALAAYKEDYGLEASA